MALVPSASKFLLKFRIQDDGLESGIAQQMATKRAGAPKSEGFLGDSTRFTYFPQLPVELRLKIWDYLITPRIVQIFCLPDINFGRDQLGSAGGGERNNVASHPYSDMLDIDFSVDDYQFPEELEHGRQPHIPPIPVILHINQESRRHGLRHYELSFSWKVPHVLADLDIGMSVSSASSPSSQPRRGSPPSWSEPRIYFNFALDAVHLAGELEPCDSYGFNSPMTYFLRKEDCLRVRHISLSFGALHYGATASQQIFGSLFHVVDRFNPPHGRVLVTVSDRDEGINLMIGAASPLVAPSSPQARTRKTEVDGSEENRNTLSTSARGGMTAMEREYASRPRAGDGPRDNVVQKLWSDWYRGSSHKSYLAKMRFDLIHDWDLADQIAQSDAIMSSPRGRSELGSNYERTASRVDMAGTNHNPDGTSVQITSTNFYDMEEDYASIPEELRL